jgi:hypothetical protein
MTYTNLRRLADGPPAVFASTSLGARAEAHAARFVRAYTWFDALLGPGPDVRLLVLDENVCRHYGDDNRQWAHPSATRPVPPRAAAHQPRQHRPAL